MVTGVSEDPGAAFAALMSGAAASADAEAAAAAGEAPYGYTRDRQTGEVRPKKTPGRGGRTPSLDELKGAQGEPGPDNIAPGSPPAPDERPGDVAPDEKLARRRGSAARKAAAAADPVPFQPGRIARGMNRLYRRTGKIIRAFDPVIGQAVIEATKAEDEDDVTVGEAWEDLARANPRVRRFLLKLIAGGAYGQLIMAHMPILLAVAMKPAVLKLIPFSRLIESLAEQDGDEDQAQDGGEGIEQLLGGLTGADVGQMAALAEDLLGQLGARPDLAAAAQAAAAAPRPTAVRTQAAQPRRTTRAQRRRAS